MHCLIINNVWGKLPTAEIQLTPPVVGLQQLLGQPSKLPILSECVPNKYSRHPTQSKCIPYK